MTYQYDANNQIVARYTHGPGIDEPLSLEKNGQKYYYHLDGLGSVTGMTDSTGDVVQRYEYDSFGNIVSMSDPNFVQPYTYTSREYDSESGLYFSRARYYDARVGRFISPDPSLTLNGNPSIPFLLYRQLHNAKELNSFVYAANNPLLFTDPTGLAVIAYCCKCSGVSSGDACSAYALCGNADLWVACMIFPNDCISRCIRKCLLNKWHNCKYDNGFQADHIACYKSCLNSCF